MTTQGTDDRVGAIVLAAGQSERFGGRDKLLATVAGLPLVAFSLRAFASTPTIDALVIVASAANRGAIAAVARDVAPTARVVLGGERRRDSVRAGLDALADCGYVVVHDGARPLVSRELIEAALAGAIESGAALCAIPVADTLKRSDETGLVRSTVSREALSLAQTPQAFRRDLLLRAHESTNADATDDAALIEWLGEPVRLVIGSSLNVKVTTPADLALVETLLQIGTEPEKL